ncbi:membrane protein [Vibrio sinaloensis]|uniref:porin n=1 Tax=Photobacterium sp. (strain ATCC 43367) TaxID=379097 RepID=UPI00057DDDCC|nr:porin [Vibrio sinaloensis]KIE20100.1 membrane protein [Vibrio sinaloensis]
MNIKPLVISMSILATGSTVAAEIYSSENNTVELSGWAKAIALRVNADDSDKDAHVFTDAHLKVKATHTVDEEVKLIGSFAINTGNSTDKNAEFGDIKLEFDHSRFGNVSLGDTGNSFGVVEKAKQGEGKNLFAVSQGGVNGQGIRYKNTFSDLEFSANYETQSDSSEDSNYATSFNYKTDDFSAAVAYGSDGDDASSVGVAGEVKFGDFTFGATVISFENAQKLTASESVDIELDKPNDGKTFSVAAAYQYDDFKFYGSFQIADADLDGKEVEAQTAYLGVKYEMTDAFNTDFVVQNGYAKSEGDKEDGTAFKVVAKYSF